ncbi:hypothetical protein SRB5_34720 [Streptomyces sp. RB5]|uniref:Lipoprotein n=1 Tax=Streptomyces smaragdinus TaxID=2585196 RepID=A0A7K0CIN6_9ACTN|nr:DUF1396 domain-containing protein [Streptomyces smaragdinus]MQY13328.1 hypothetical protein [Streptomyces smaragdinus]
MSVIRTKAAAALLAGALLAGGAVACNDDSSSGGKKKTGSSSNSENGGGNNGAVEVSPAVAIQKAVKNNKDIKSMTFTMKGKTPDGPFEADAAIDMEKSLMSMKMKGGMGTEAGTFEIRVVDKAMFMKADGQPSEDGKTWLKVNLTTLGEGEDPFSGAGAGTDPTGEAESMTASKDLKKVGEEKIGGVQTTHYTGTVTLDQIRETFKGEDPKTRAKHEKSLKEYEDLGADKLTMDMWIDGKSQTKQVRTRSETKKGPIDMTIVFGEINVPVTVETPPAAEVMDLSKTATQS